MTNVTLIHNAIKSQLSALFPTKTVIPNPFELDQNNDNFLKDGYGIFYGPGSLPDFDLGIHIQGYQREFNVVLAKKVYRLESNNDQFETVQLALIEDQNTMVNSFADIRSIDINVVRLEYVSDSGVEFIFAEKNNYLALTTSFEVTYKEDKTYT